MIIIVNHRLIFADMALSCQLANNSYPISSEYTEMVFTETMERPCLREPSCFLKISPENTLFVVCSRTNWIHEATLGSEVAFTQAWNIKELTGVVKQ